MSKTRITADGVAEPPAGTFTNAFRVDRTVYVSGQTAVVVDGVVPLAGDAYAQATQAFTAIRALVEAAGGSMDDVVKLTVFLTDMARRADFSRARRAFFSGDFPCSTLVEVAALAHPDLLVEIEAIAVVS
jgi:reactive intermediate/imine deaminase